MIENVHSRGAYVIIEADGVWRFVFAIRQKKLSCVDCYRIDQRDSRQDPPRALLKEAASEAGRKFAKRRRQPDPNGQKQLGFKFRRERRNPRGTTSR